MVQYCNCMETGGNWTRCPAHCPRAPVHSEKHPCQPFLGPGLLCNWGTCVTRHTFRYTNNSSLRQQTSPSYLVGKCELTIMTNNEEVLASLAWEEQNSRCFGSSAGPRLGWPPLLTGSPRAMNRRHPLCKLERGCSLSAAQLTGPWCDPHETLCSMPG